MPLGMIIRRMWHESRLLGILLLAVCLVTGFFALGPLYVRAVSEAGLRFAVAHTAPERLNITLSSRQPIGPDVWEALDQELSGVVTRVDASARSSGVTCGFRYRLGQPTTVFTPRTPNCYQLVSYSNLPELFTLAEGRWPVRLATPDQASPAGLSDEELSRRQLGVYNRGQVEAVVTVQAAAEAGVEVGNRIVVGARPERTAIVRIVGLVEPALPPGDPFWEGQRIVLVGEKVPTGLATERYDFGLIVAYGAYDDWLAGVTAGNTYLWWMATDPDVIHADTLDTLEARLSRLQGVLQARYPDLLIFTGLTDLIAAFRRGLQATEGPIILLSGAVLVLMLYHLVTTVALVLEQQGAEWASITSRGGSLIQLMKMQLLTVACLGAVGAATGPFIAQGLLLLLERVGPLARTLGGATLGVRSLPGSAFGLSLAAAAAAAVALTVPAWPAARRSLLLLKQLISRPPTRPLWARYFLDVALLIVGLALMLRLYFLISGDVGSSVGALLQDPASLIRLIATGASEAGGLNDPFNLLGPALVLTGAALLWLRLFPWLMRLIGRLFGRNAGLTLPLALWNVERDPGHYAQLVLLLIGTLALGTASLALAATRDGGAWAVARGETGADAAVTFDPRQTEVAAALMSLPDVIGGARLLVVETPRRAGEQPIALFGVDPETFGAVFADWEAAVAPLRGLTPPPLPGQRLPEDATAVTVEVYAEPSPDEPTATQLTADFLDAAGVPLAVEMTTVDPTDAGRFVTYRAALPEGLGQAPWRLVGLRLVSRRGELPDFQHTIYLDDLRAIGADGEATRLAGFEDGDSEGWAAGLRHFQLPSDLSVMITTAQAAEGESSLQIDYRIRRVGGGLSEPALTVHETPAQAVPVVVSEAFADYVGRRSDRRRPLAAGDEAMIELPLTLGRVQFRYRVAAVVPDFPTMTARDSFLFARADALRPALNGAASVHAFYDWNQVWLDLAARQPDDDLRRAVAGLPGVEEARYAWDRYNDIQRDPLPNAITGMLFAGFWVSLSLSVLDFGFYLAVTARRRAISFAVLQAMGWEGRNIWGLLAIEQAALVTPALLVGALLGALLAYLLLPFLELIGGEALRLPVMEVFGLLLVLLVAFIALMGATAVYLRRMPVSQVLRRGEE